MQSYKRLNSLEKVSTYNHNRGGVSQTLRIIVVKLSPRSELDRQNKMAIKHLYNDVDLHKLLASARLVRRVYGCNVYTAIIHERVH